MAIKRASTFAELLRQFRLAAGLSQEALAERANLSARGISDLERGLRLRPRRETVRMLANALGLSYEEATWLEEAVDRGRGPPGDHVRVAPRPPDASDERTTAPGDALERRPCPFQFPHPVLIGREAELTRVAEALRRGRTTSQVVLVGAPAGSGKSALVGELVRRAEHAQVLCLAGAGYEQEGAVLFGPFHDALSGYLLPRPPDRLRAALGAAAVDLAVVVPELRYHLGLPERASTDPQTERLRLYAAVHGFLRSLALGGPVLLCLEDLHAADAASLQLFSYLVRQLGQTARELPLVLIGTYRSDEVSPGQPLAQLLAALARDPRVEHLRLQPLGREETTRLAASLLGGPVGEQLGAWLYAQSDGNPLFLEQIVLTLREEGRLIRRAGLWHEVAGPARAIPPAARTLIGQRLERLGPRCRETLAVCAVVGQTVPYELLLAALAPRDEFDILGDLAEATDAHLLQEAGSCYVFSHALVREAIYADIGPPQRMRLHGRIGELLERMRGPRAADRTPELAHHFSLAGHSAPIRAKALRYSLEAGRRAAGLSSHREALAHFARACELVEHAHEEVDLATRLEALEGRAYAEHGLARWPESVATFRQVLALAEDPVRRAAARNMAASVLLHTGEIPDVLAESEAGLAELASAQGPEAALIRVYLRQKVALVWYLQGRYRKVLALGRLMCREASEGEPRSQLWAQSVVAWGYLGQGRVSEGLRHAELAVSAAERAGEKVYLATACGNLGLLNYAGGRLATARQQIERALTLYRESASELRGVNELQHLCRVLVAEGELGLAREQAALAVALETEGQERWAADGFQILGTIHALRAEWRDALRSFERALQIRRGVHDSGGTVETTVALGAVHQSMGDWARARALYGEATTLAKAIDIGPPIVLARRHLGRLHLLMGDPRAAHAEIEAGLTIAQAIPESLEYAPMLLAGAELWLEDDEPTRALRLAETALESAATVEHRVEAHVLLAGLHLGLGHGSLARAHAAEAIAGSERLGSPRLTCLAYLASSALAAALRARTAAATAFETALRHAEAAELPYERALALRAYAEYLARDAHGRARSAAMLAEADRIVERLGAVLPRPRGIAGLATRRVDDGRQVATSAPV